MTTIRGKAARGSSSYPTPELARDKAENIVQESYEKGTRWAGYALCGMFAFMTFGAVVFGW